MALQSDNLSADICLEKAAFPRTFKNADSACPCKIRKGNDRNRTSSEISNLLSVCSGHDLSTDNTENKAIISFCDVREGRSMLSKVAVSQAAGEDQGLTKQQSFSGNITSLNQPDTLKVSECNGDDTSCISGAESPCRSGDHACDIDRMNVSCSSPSVNSFLMRGLVKTVDAQLAFSCPARSLCEVEKRLNCSCRPTKLSKDSLQKKAHFSVKSNSCEVYSLRDVDTGAGSLKDDLSECSREQEESSFAKIANFSLDCCKCGTFDIAESVTPTSEVDKGDPATAAKKSSGQNKMLAEVLSVLGPLEQSQTVQYSDESDRLVDVKVCDICGDAGREDLLATCSKCNDGAEHIYCMRVRLEKVPEGEWMCEDCMLLKETDKPRQNKEQKVVRSPQGSSSNEACQNARNLNANIGAGLQLDTKASDVEKSEPDNLSSIPLTSAKRPPGKLESDSMKRRRALEITVGSPRMSIPCREALLSRDSPHQNLDKVKVESTCYISPFSERAFNSTRVNEHSNTNFGSNSSKSRTGLQMSQGVLTKAKSFNISHLKQNVKAPNEIVLDKNFFSQETAAIDKSKHGIVRRMSKSLSFNNFSSGHAKAADSRGKMSSSNISIGKDPQRLTQPKDHDVRHRKDKVKLDNPLVSSPLAGSCNSALRIGTKIASDGGIMSPHSSRTECNLKRVRSNGNSSTSLKPMHQLAHDGSKYLNNAQVVADLSPLTKFDSSHKLKPSGVPGKDRFRSNPSLPSGRCCNRSDLTRQDKLPQSASCNQAWKAQKTSYFSSAREHISAGNQSAYTQKCDTICEAAEPCQVMSSPQKSVLGSGRSKEASQSDVKAIPKLDYTWKGGFKIKSGGRLPSFCYGIQAHLSTCASPKVPDVLKKLSCMVLLEETSRSSVWPTQFMENHPKEDSIGVYFFAEDIVSYRENYKSLVEHMITYDLALKGNVYGIDLLIFSSIVLPERSQRWNKMFFLWGVFFKGNEQCPPNSQKEPFVPGLSNDCLAQDLSLSRMYGIQNLCSSGQSWECSSVSNFVYDAQQSTCLTDIRELTFISSDSEDGCYEHQSFAFDQQPSTKYATTSNKPMQNQLCRDMQHTRTFLAKEVGLPDRRREDYPPSDCNTNGLIWSSGRATPSMDVTDFTAPNGYPLPADSGQVDGMLRVSSSECQMISSDCKDVEESEFLDLGLSLGIGKRYDRLTPVSNFQVVVDRNNQDYNRNTAATSRTDNGDDYELPGSLELSLELHRMHEDATLINK